MTEPDHLDRAPGMGDPTRSDDTDAPGLRSGVAGSSPDDQVVGPAPGATPDGEDVQVSSGPGPQTDWLRSAQGLGDHETDDLGR